MAEQKVTLPQWVVLLIVGIILSLFGWFGKQMISGIDDDVKDKVSSAVYEADKKAMQIEIDALKDRVKDLERSDRWRRR